MRVFVSDFDGTITVRDIAQMILDKFAGPKWLEIEKEYRARRMGTREAITRQFALVKATRSQIISFVDNIAQLDPYFMDFVKHLDETGQRIEIVSEGLDLYIIYLLSKWGLNIPFRTNRTELRDSTLTIGHPFCDSNCMLCGTCKMRRVLELRAEGNEVVYFGNGYSDICPSLEADKVFAKGVLADLCDEEEREHTKFKDFGDVLEEVRSW